MLRLNYIVRQEIKHRSIKDQRRKTNYILASYLDDAGNEYRKSFESYVNPIVPNNGDHKTLNNLAIQY